LAAAIVAGPFATSSESADLVAQLRERLLELDQAFAVGACELPLQPTLPQTE
jgi:hypothetical protein